MRMLNVQQEIQELANYFQIPTPPHVFDSPKAVGFAGVFDPTAYTIHFPDENPSRDTIAHEVAHASHVHYRIPCVTPACEAYASVFARVWVAMKEGQATATLTCDHCHYKVLFRSTEGTCLNCGSTYHKSRGSMVYFKCSGCGSTVTSHGETASCSNCGATYKKQRTYRQVVSKGQIMAGAVGSAVIASILGSAAYGKFPPKTREEAGPLVGSLVASGFAGMLTGMVLSGGS